MRLHVFFLLTTTAASAFQPPSRVQPLGTAAFPLYESLSLDRALEHAQRARQFESAGQWQPALAEYTEVINQSINALRSNPGPSQDPTDYYVLGLANIDCARMYHLLQVDLLFDEQVSQNLAAADQALRNAAAIYQQRGISMWPVYGALANVHILQGNLAAAQADVQRIQVVDPRYLPAAAAVQQLNSLPPGFLQASPAVRSNSATTEQWAFRLELAKKVATFLLPPAYQKVLTVAATATLAGIEAYRQWQQTKAAQ